MSLDPIVVRPRCGRTTIGFDVGSAKVLGYTRTMAKTTVSVDDYLAKLEHPMKDGILALRKTILSIDPEMTEQIKWNAPSFCYGGDDRITFRLPPNGKGGLQLIFHRGAKSKDSSNFKFVDPSGLVEWAAPDRGVVTFTRADEITSKTPKLVKLIKAWLQATDTRGSNAATFAP